MAAKISAEMKRALKLVREGATGYMAAKLCHLTPGALYKNADYRAIIAARKPKEKS